MTQNESDINCAPKVSVIIPCYNDGAYLDEAVGSVLAQTLKNFEIIIVDDGSTDPVTIRMLDNYVRPNTYINRTKNQGPSAARNVGISMARGKYILPLDADDKIGESYLATASEILDTHPEIGIVYCRAELFGSSKGEWDLPPYSLETMLVRNVIFASAMFRRTSWQEVGGYNPNMVYSNEDYDFWLSILEHENCGVYRINEVLFYYRRRQDSRSIAFGANKGKDIDMLTLIFYNHTNYFLREGRMRAWVKEMERLREMISASPAMRLEESLETHPRIKHLHRLICLGLQKLFVFVKTIIRE